MRNFMLLLEILKDSHMLIKVCDAIKNCTYYSGAVCFIYEWLTKGRIVNNTHFTSDEIMLSALVDRCEIKDKILIIYIF